MSTVEAFSPKSKRKCPADILPKEVDFEQILPPGNYPSDTGFDCFRPVFRQPAVLSDEMAYDWPLSGWAYQGLCRGSQSAECFLHRRGQRRCLEDGRLWPHLEADL